jgi:hypothetical protein
MKIRPVGAELFHADGQTNGHDEANSRFSQFCESSLKMKLLFWCKHVLRIADFLSSGRT